MKNKFRLIQIPLVLLCSAAFLITELGYQGHLNSPFLRDTVFHPLLRLPNLMTDLKFHLRGQKPPKNKIVIVEIDEPSLSVLGRWPWHRDVTAFLIQKIFDAGAKVVGLDMVLSEPDPRVPDELKDIIKKQGMGKILDQFETDMAFANMVKANRDHLVLGWQAETICQPLYDPKCVVNDPDVISGFSADFEKFAFSRMNGIEGFQKDKTPLMSVVNYNINIPMFSREGRHSGCFNGETDPDGSIRRNLISYMANGKPFPSLALEMARVGQDENLQISLKGNRIKSIGFANSGWNVPITPLGMIGIDFRGSARTFPYVSAIDVLKEGENTGGGRLPAADAKSSVLKDAYVFVGATALGIYDLRSWPFEGNGPGVEVHATILDNLLSHDLMIPGSSSTAVIWFLLLLMIAGGIGFGIVVERLEAIPGLIFFLGCLTLVGFLDTKALFAHNLNWNTSYLLVEMVSIFVFTLAVKYVLEEQKKKFIRGAFAKYVAPAVVDSILKDPTKLAVGGEKKELTIMFSDIRSFTTFSERLDAKALASLLSEYLGTMTQLVFKNEGTLDKYIGDAIMAFWGAPLDQPRHAANACMTAREMMAALAKMKPTLKEKYGVDINIGIGINSGTVSVGNMGSEQNFAYTVIGDHVNLASRLEGLTKYYGCSILTTSFTLEDIAKANEPLPPYRTLDFVKVKGKKTAIEVIQILEEDIPAEARRLFDEARDLYIQKKWDQAVEKFKQSSRAMTGSDTVLDGPCAMYIERCGELKTTQPDNWDGTWEMHNK